MSISANPYREVRFWAEIVTESVSIGRRTDFLNKAQLSRRFILKWKVGFTVKRG